MTARKAELTRRTAAEFGADPHAVLMSFERIANDGALVMAHVDGLSIFKRATTNAERGVPDGDVRDRHLTAGVTHCAPINPAHKLSSLANLIYQNTNRYSFNLTSVEHAGFRGMRYILFGELSRAWRENHERYLGEFDATRDMMIEEIPAYRGMIETEWRLLGEKSWQSIWLKVRADEIRVDGHKWGKGQKAEYIQAMITHALRSIPSQKAIEDKVAVYIETAVFTALSEAVKERLEVVKARAKIDQVEARRMLHREEAQTAVAKTRAERRAAESEINKLDNERQAMREVIEDNLRQQIARMGDPRREMLSQLRDRMADTAQEARTNIEQNGRMYKPNVTRLDNMIETFGAFHSSLSDAGMPDTKLEDLFAQLRGAMTARLEDGRYNVPAIAKALGNIEKLSAGVDVKAAEKDDLAARLRGVKPSLEDQDDTEE